jgi:hypothetical protein
MRDARRLRLASYDHDRNEYFPAVPVEIEVERTDAQGRVSRTFSQSGTPRPLA